MVSKRDVERWYTQQNETYLQEASELRISKVMKVDHPHKHTNSSDCPRQLLGKVVQLLLQRRTLLLVFLTQSFLNLSNLGFVTNLSNNRFATSLDNESALKQKQTNRHNNTFFNPITSAHRRYRTYNTPRRLMLQ